MPMKKVYVVGIDALTPKLLLKFVQDGELPSFKKLLETGGFSKALAALPAQTPENWTTIATGAWPGTHGIATWGRRLQGVSVTEYFGDESMSSNLCRAEYLWEALARKGLKSVLLNFVGYPPTTDKAVYIDWFWRPGRWYFEICSAAVYASKETLKEIAEKGAPVRRMLEQALLVPVSFNEEKTGFINLHKSKSPPLHLQIVLRPVRPGAEVVYHGFLLDEAGEGYDALVVCRGKKCEETVCKLKVGQWASFREEFDANGKKQVGTCRGKDCEETVCKLKVGQWASFREEFDVNGKKQVGTVRLKLVELSRDGSRFKLYRSQIHPVDSFAHPPEIGKELTDKFGPYINEAVERFIPVLDAETVVEEFDSQRS